MRRTLITALGWATLGLILLALPFEVAMAGTESLPPDAPLAEDIEEDGAGTPLDPSWRPPHPWPFSLDPVDAYRILAPGHLPKDQRSPRRRPGIRPPDYTSMLLTLSRSRHLLPPELRVPLDELTNRQPLHAGPPNHPGSPSQKTKTVSRAFERSRPYSAGFFESDAYPLRVHYRSRLTSERARQTLEFAEISYGRLLEMGFRTPVPDGGLGGSDGLDIYLVGEIRSGGGAFTAVTESDYNLGDDRLSCAAYVMVFEELDMAAEMPVFVAHEMVHAFQAAMDYSEWPFFWEATAVAIEDLIFDDINDYYSFIDDFQRRPHYALNDTSGLFPYGAGIFAQFLDEVLGDGDGRLLADLWELSGQPGAENEPDYLDVIDEVAAGLDGVNGRPQSLSEAVALFTGWRYFAAEMGDVGYYEEASAWPSATQVPIIAELTLADLPAIDLAPPPEDYVNPQDLGSNYYRLNTQSAATASFHITLEGDDFSEGVRWGVVVIRYFDDRTGEIETFTPPLGDDDIELTFPAYGADHIIIAPLNLGSALFDADSPGQARSYRLHIERE